MYIYNNHEDYKDIYMSKSKSFWYQYFLQIPDGRTCIVTVNDEGPVLQYKEHDMDDLIETINEEDWGGDDPNNFDEESLIAYVKSTVADKDSSSAWILIVNGEVIAHGNNVRITQNMNQFHSMEDIRYLFTHPHRFNQDKKEFYEYMYEVVGNKEIELPLFVEFLQAIESNTLALDEDSLIEKAQSDVNG